MTTEPNNTTTGDRESLPPPPNDPVNGFPAKLWRVKSWSFKSPSLWRNGALISLGYMLSPLSWWNDVFFNLPIALVVGYGASWLQPHWFFPGTVIGYWLSNVVGMVMLQFGASDALRQNASSHWQRELLWGFGGATLYTLVGTALVYFHVLDLPDFLADLHP